MRGTEQKAEAGLLTPYPLLMLRHEVIILMLHFFKQSITREESAPPSL